MADIDRTRLPAPEYATDDPFEWPTNWPAIADVPRMTETPEEY